MIWTTAQAAQAAGLSVSGFRTLAARARAAGVELQCPRSSWPDGRTPVYDGHAVLSYLAARPGRGHRPVEPEDQDQGGGQRSEPNGEQLTVDEDPGTDGQ